MLWMIGSAVWWMFALGASWQAWKAWGPASALASLFGLYLGATLLYFGSYLTIVGAVMIGARAESAQQKQLAVYRA